MILFYLNNQNKMQARFIRELYRSCPHKKQLQSTARFLTNTKLNENADLIVFAGILRGDGLIYQYCKDNNKNYLYVDHAYLYRGYNERDTNNEWMRITPNSFTWNKNYLEPVDRWNQYFAKSFSLSQWQNNKGKQILVLPPSAATKYLFPESVDWMAKTIEKISQKTDAPIRIREKPLQPTVDPVTNKVIGGFTFAHDDTIEKELMDAKCIVTFNSAVPVLGTVLGIPCYCSPCSAAYPMSINIDEINNPCEPNRQNWLNQLVYHQYTTSEMRSGKVWNLLQKYIPR